MAQTKAPTDFRHDDDCEADARAWGAARADVCQCGVREVGWVARESNAIMSEGMGWYEALDSPRGQAYLARKRALLDYIEATR